MHKCRISFCCAEQRLLFPCTSMDFILLTQMQDEHGKQELSAPLLGAASACLSSAVAPPPHVAAPRARPRAPLHGVARCFLAPPLLGHARCCSDSWPSAAAAPRRCRPAAALRTTAAPPVAALCRRGSAAPRPAAAPRVAEAPHHRCAAAAPRVAAAPPRHRCLLPEGELSITGT